MGNDELIAALRRTMVETGSLACLGCGHEHNCSTQGCAILRAAAELIERLQAQLAESERRERAAVEAMVEAVTIIASTYRGNVGDDGICGLCEFDADHGLDGCANKCPGLDKDDYFEWRGPQEAGKGGPE